MTDGRGRRGKRGPSCELSVNLRAGPEQAYHDQGVREAHLGAIHGAVARALENGEDVMVLGVEDDALDRGLRFGGWSCCQRMPCSLGFKGETQPVLLLVRQAHASQVPSPQGLTVPFVTPPTTLRGDALTCMVCSEDDMIGQCVYVCECVLCWPLW